MYYPPAAPLSIGGVLDNGFALFRASLKHAFLLGFIGTLLSVPFIRLGQRAIFDAGGLGWNLLLISLANLAYTLLVYGAVVAMIDSIAKGRQMSLLSAAGVACRRWPALLVVFACTSVAVIVGMLLLIVPGIFLAVSLIFASVAVVTDRKGPFASLKYSHELVSGHWWRTACLLTVMTIIALVVYFVLGMIAGFGAAMNPDAAIEPLAMPWYVDFLLTPLLSGVLLPLGYSLFLASYNDLKLRREGGDIADRIADRIAAAEA